MTTTHNAAPGAKRVEILPVLLGGDMNCYSVARAFHEAYGAISHAFGRYEMGETKYSRIVKFTTVPDLEEDAVMLAELSRFAAGNPEAQKFALGCTDDYAAMLIRNREALTQMGYIVPYIGKELADSLVSKENFYNYCEKYNIPYPATVVVRAGEEAKLDAPPFPYPAILKPSSSILYWKNPFEGMKKVYVARNAAEARAIAKKIFGAGYPDALVLQDMIPGADSKMRVLTAYSGEDGRVRAMVLGHLLLEEHTPRALGNHAAILTEYEPELMQTLRDFLDAIGYVGFSNFDIKYDERDGQYKVFEINLRQGRSNYYVTGAGVNIARLLVEDRLLHIPYPQPLMYNGESFWHSIPKRVVWKYTDGPELVARAKALAAEGEDTTALGYDFDLKGNPLRRLYVMEHMRRYYRKYAKYCDKPGKRQA